MNGYLLKLGQPIEVKLIAHSKSRDDTYEVMRKTKATVDYYKSLEAVT